ncbi:uncharacterized protein LOC119560901 [Drosophila subpulchrella]|uniref:uncharacterized protein LOC119560901 n=1 Tax=Drosophila subpulchrella TaxID=1486046 RepID=UPI0018A185B8|nr:uncharacterized protein LOC119560901 [Drosophila subpulchrella]
MGLLAKVRVYWKTKIRKVRPSEPVQSENPSLVQSRSEIYFHPTDACQSLQRDFDDESDEDNPHQHCELSKP